LVGINVKYNTAIARYIFALLVFNKVPFEILTGGGGTERPANLLNFNKNRRTLTLNTF